MSTQDRGRGRRFVLLALGFVTLVLLGVYLQRLWGSDRLATHRATTDALADFGKLPPMQAATLEQSRAQWTGTVFGIDRTGLAGATVCASCAVCNPDSASTAPSCTSTNPAGQYSLERLPPGDYLLTASATGYLPKVANAGKPIGIASSDLTGRSDLDIQLEQGGFPITGTVVDTTGGPVAGATVQTTTLQTRLDNSYAVTAQTTTSDDEGRFALTCAAGPNALLATAEGYAPVYANRSAPASDVVLIVTPASTIKGIVVTTEGQPVANIHVMVDKSLTPRRHATSDANGRFAISDLGPGTYTARATGLGWMGDYPGTITLDLADTVDDIVVVVRKNAVLRGRVVAANDAPCAHGKVHLGPRHGAGDSLPLLDAMADAQGEITFEAVPPGTYESYVMCGGSEPQATQPIEVSESDQSGVVWKLPHALSIEGRVVDRRGTPLPQFILTLQPNAGTDGLSPSKVTDAQGAFVFRGLPAGSYDLTSPDLTAPVHVQLSPQRSVTNLTVVADNVGDMLVRVVTPSGGPVDDVDVTAIASNRRPSNPAQDLGGGSYRLGPLTAGLYSVYVSDGINPRVRAGGPDAELIVRAGESTKVEVRFGGHRGRITGRVVDEVGAPIENVWVQARPSDEHDQGSMVQQAKIQIEGRRMLTDLEGRFELEGLAEDALFTVAAERPLGGQAQQAGVKPGSNIDIVLQALGTLSGAVVDSQGTPVPHFTLMIVNERTGQQRTESIFDLAGVFRLDDITPGSIQATVIDPVGNTANATWTLAPKQKLTDLRVELAAERDGVPQGNL